PVSVLHRLRDHLAEDGHLIVSIPNIANWTVRLQLLFGRFRYTDRGILDRTHLRFYTVATLPEMLADAGFSVVKLQASVPVPGVTNEALARVAHRVGNLRPGFFGYNLIATCTKGS
ncbi:MAG: class I SAM-dependent methyltransferase, partial [Microthrixaceae bacterium]|nr:class I SAM-dependent methyltransferase [Microthrixaceae bacterium]